MALVSMIDSPLAAPRQLTSFRFLLLAPLSSRRVFPTIDTAFQFNTIKEFPHYRISILVSEFCILRTMDDVGKLSATQKSELMDNVQLQILVANTQEMLRVS